MSSQSEDFSKVKIKQEKLTPPRPKEKDADEIINDIIPTLFNASPKESSAANEDEKKAIEPVKSSNEILAELFRVFNAAPPESLLNDDYLLDKTKKRSHKDKKHKKKSKKRSRSSNDDNSDNENKKSRKKSKKKKHKKSKKHDTKSPDKVKIKREGSIDLNSRSKSPQPPATTTGDLKISDLSDFIISSEDESNIGNKSRPDPVVVKQEKKDSPKHVPGKIVIKSLKNSSVFKEVARKELTQSRNGGRDGSSELSLSDEETYLKEKQLRSAGRRENRDRDRYRDRADRDRYRTSSRDRFRRSWRNSRSRSRSRYRHRSRSRSHRSDDLVIDKKRLLEIARKNAISMFNNGSLPGTQAMTQEVKNKVLMKMRYGGKSVEELTDFCKKLSKGESLNDLSSLSSNDDSDHDKHGNDRAFHHPFVLKDRGPIVMNIKNATPIPPKSAEQTKAILMQFPVSSGQQHRLNENEWVPVPATKPPRPEPPQPVPPLKPQQTKNVFQKPLPAETQLPAFVPNTPTDTIPPVVPVVEKIIEKEAIAPVPVKPPSPVIESVFPHSDKVVDVTSIITKRLNAMRKLQDNPTDPEALKMMYNSQKDMSAWATSKFTPGQFTGSTGANILSARELTSGQQAWAKRDQLISTAPVSGGMGMHLLQKMGWRPGEGLGKGKNGSLQPLLLEVKLDKRGLVANEEDPNAIQLKNRRKKPSPPTTTQVQQSIESKHPVSLLGELSAKRKWGAPFYDLVDENGPAHQRNFIYKVIINGMMYQPAITCNTKKEAKALAAKYCLQQMGILPS